MSKNNFQLPPPDNNQINRYPVSDTKKKQGSSFARNITPGRGGGILSKLGTYLNTCWLAKALGNLKSKVFSCTKDVQPEPGNREYLIQELAKDSKQDQTSFLSPVFERGPEVGVYESMQEILMKVNGGVRLKENALKAVL